MPHQLQYHHTAEMTTMSTMTRAILLGVWLFPLAIHPQEYFEKLELRDTAGWRVFRRKQAEGGTSEVVQGPMKSNKALLLFEETIRDSAKKQDAFPHSDYLRQILGKGRGAFFYRSYAKSIDGDLIVLFFLVPRQDVEGLVFRCSPFILRMSSSDRGTLIEKPKAADAEVIRILNDDYQSDFDGDEVFLWSRSLRAGIKRNRFKFDVTSVAKEKQPKQPSPQAKAIAFHKDRLAEALKRPYPRVVLSRRIDLRAARMGLWEQHLWRSQPTWGEKSEYDTAGFLKVFDKWTLFDKPRIARYDRRDRPKLLEPSDVVIEARQALFKDFDMDRMIDLTCKQDQSGPRIWRRQGREKVLPGLHWNMLRERLVVLGEFYLTVDKKSLCYVLCRTEGTKPDSGKPLYQLEYVRLMKEEGAWKLVRINDSILDEYWTSAELFSVMTWKQYTKKLAEGKLLPKGFKDTFSTKLLKKYGE